MIMTVEQLLSMLITDYTDMSRRGRCSAADLLISAAMAVHDLTYDDAQEWVSEEITERMVARA